MTVFVQIYIDSLGRKQTSNMIDTISIDHVASNIQKITF